MRVCVCAGDRCCAGVRVLVCVCAGVRGLRVSDLRAV